MSKLLSANASRLLKDKVFWAGILFMSGLGLLVVCMDYFNSIRYDMYTLLDDDILDYVVFSGGCAAVFCSMFIGTDYSDGTIRNKLMVGHPRPSIYLSNWLTGMAAAVVMSAAFLAAYCVPGVFLLEKPAAPAGRILFYILISLFTVTAYASVFTMLSMLITRKSTAAVVCLLVFLGLLMLAAVIKEKLDAPEFISGYELTVNGLEQTDPEPNPKYLQPAARKVYQFFLDVLPAGQCIQLVALEVLHPYLLMLYSAVVSVLTTVFGIFVFQKKNLK